MSDSKYLRPGVDFCMAHVVEEAGELMAALGKTMRWGLWSFNPELPTEQREPNIEWVKREIADLRAALDRFEAELPKGNEPARYFSPIHGD